VKVSRERLRYVRGGGTYKTPSGWRLVSELGRLLSNYWVLLWGAEDGKCGEKRGYVEHIREVQTRGLISNYSKGP